MRKLLFILLLLVVGTAGLGYYLGWFRVTTSRDAETGQRGVELNVDTNKIKADTQKAKEKLGGSTEKGTTSSAGE